MSACSKVPALPMHELICRVRCRDADSRSLQCNTRRACIKRVPAQQGASAGVRLSGICDHGHEIALHVHGARASFRL